MKMTQMSELTESQACCSTPDETPRIFISPLLCNSCGTCAEVCPFGLPRQGKNRKYEIKEPELCVECSACHRNCPTEAIFMQEREGCGCLWNVIKRRRKTVKTKDISCE